MPHRGPSRTSPRIPPGLWKNRRTLAVAALCPLLLLPACAGKKTARKAAVPSAAPAAAFQEHAAAAPLSAALAPTPPQHLPPRPPSPARPKPPAPTTIGEVAEKLSTSFVVAEPVPGTLRISRGPASAAQRPALFEEAILLGRIRGALQSESLEAPGSSASFKAGIATIRFGPRVESGPAAVALAKILALPGVLRADAVFQPPAPPQPRF